MHSDENILKPEITYTENKGLKELIIRYPKVKSKLPGWIDLMKMNRYKRFHKLGLGMLARKGFMPDLVHCNIMNPSGLIAKLFKKKNCIPFVITEHWTGYLPSDGRYSNSKILKLSLPKIAKRAEIILPVSNDLSQALQQHNLGNKFKVIKNVVNTEKFFIQDSVKDRFLVVADLEDSQKNIKGIIEAFQAFHTINPNIKLSIAGGGVDEMSLKQLVLDIGLENTIQFHGRINAEELNNLLSKSYASVLFSNYENLPCVIVESFAAGVPFIATKVGGIPEIINEERGILIDSKNKEQLVGAFQKAISTNWDQSKIREYAIANFSYAKIAEEFNQVYKEILGK